MKLKLVVAVLIIFSVVVITVATNTTVSREKERNSKTEQTVDGVYSKSISEYEIGKQNVVLDKVTYKVIGVDCLLILLSCILLASSCKDYMNKFKKEDRSETTY